MKKRNILIVLVLILSFSSNVFADGESINIYMDGELLEVSQEPIIENGTTLVPMRNIFEALGMKVHWNEETKTASGITDGLTIDITIGSNKAYVNGSEKILLVPAKIINGSTMVPLRFVSESAGCKVDWDGSKREITISTYEGDVLMESTNKMADSSKLYAVDGVGKYKDYRMLKGYPGENEFQIYFKGDVSSYMATYEDLRSIDINEVIIWEHNNISYRNTRSELYSFFSDTSWFRSKFGVGEETLSHEWFMNTFGDVFVDWMKGIAYSNDASRLAGKYLEKESGIEYENRYEILDYIDDISEEFKNLRIKEEERQKQEEKEAMDRIKEFQNNIN